MKRDRKAGARAPTGFPPRHRSVRLAGLLLCSLFGAGGAGLAIAGFRDWRLSSASVNWPTAEAEVLKSAVVISTFQPTRFYTRQERYWRRVTFRYSVAGTEYTAEATLPVETPPPMAPQASQPRAILPSPPSPQGPSARLTIWYDPADPQTAVADRDALAAGLVTMSVGVVITLVLSLLAFGLWSRKAPGPSVDRWERK